MRALLAELLDRLACLEQDVLNQSARAVSAINQTEEYEPPDYVFVFTNQDEQVETNDDELLEVKSEYANTL